MLASSVVILKNLKMLLFSNLASRNLSRCRCPYHAANLDGRGERVLVSVLASSFCSWNWTHMYTLLNSMIEFANVDPGRLLWFPH